jgi:hypothetical protein
MGIAAILADYASQGNTGKPFAASHSALYRLER